MSNERLRHFRATDSPMYVCLEFHWKKILIINLLFKRKRNDLISHEHWAIQPLSINFGNFQIKNSHSHANFGSDSNELNFWYTCLFYYAAFHSISNISFYFRFLIFETLLTFGTHFFFFFFCKYVACRLSHGVDQHCFCFYCYTQYVDGITSADTTAFRLNS